MTRLLNASQNLSPALSIVRTVRGMFEFDSIEFNPDTSIRKRRALRITEVIIFIYNLYFSGFFPNRFIGTITLCYQKKYINIKNRGG